MQKDSSLKQWFWRHPVAAFAYAVLVGLFYLIVLPFLTVWRVRQEYWHAMQNGYWEFPVLKICKLTFSRIFSRD